jgi:hypothetical protein
MSFNSAVQPTQTLCQQDFTLAAGTLAGVPIGGTIAGGGASPAGTYQSFNSQTSKIIGVKGKTVGGVPAFQSINVNPLAATIADTLAGSGRVNINSALNTDTSVYTVFWVNTTFTGLSPC